MMVWWEMHNGERKKKKEKRKRRILVVPHQNPCRAQDRLTLAIFPYACGCVCVRVWVWVCVRVWVGMWICVDVWVFSVVMYVFWCFVWPLLPASRAAWRLRRHTSPCGARMGRLRRPFTHPCFGLALWWMVEVWWWRCDGGGVMVEVWWWRCDGGGVMVWVCDGWWHDGMEGWWGCEMARVWGRDGVMLHSVLIVWWGDCMVVRWCEDARVWWDDGMTEMWWCEDVMVWCCECVIVRWWYDRGVIDLWCDGVVIIRWCYEGGMRYEGVRVWGCDGVMRLWNACHEIRNEHICWRVGGSQLVYIATIWQPHAYAFTTRYIKSTLESQLTLFVF